MRMCVEMTWENVQGQLRTSISRCIVVTVLRTVFHEWFRRCSGGTKGDSVQRDRFWNVIGPRGDFLGDKVRAGGARKSRVCDWFGFTYAPRRRTLGETSE